MNQDSSINSITKAQNITKAITNTDIPPISQENTKNKSYIENEGNTICRKLKSRTNQIKILNLKET